MSPSMLSMLLWIPFLFVVLIAGIIFCVSGYKKGLWRALISLGATVVAILLSLLLANLLALVLTPVVSGVLPDLDMDGLPTELVDTFVNGAVKMVLALVLFSIILFITTIVLKVVSGKIKKDMWIVKEKHMRFAGLGVGLLDAVIYALVLLLPLYGTLASYMPAAETLLKLQGDGDSGISEYIGAINEHPIVNASDMAPFAALYNGLSQVGVNGAAVSIPEMADAADKTMLYFEKISQASEEELPALCLEFTEYLRDNVVKKDWFYAVASEFLQQMVTEMPELDTLDVLDMSKGDFQTNCSEVLDVMAYALEHDFLTLMEEEDYSSLYQTEFFERAGALANCSEQAVAVKNIILTKCVSNLFQGDEVAAQQFLNRFPVEKITDVALQKQEAETFMILLFGADNMDVLEALARHPDFGMGAVEEIVAQTDFATLIGVTMETELQEEDLQTYLESDAVKERFLSQLEEIATQPLSAVGFGNWCETLNVLAHDTQSNSDSWLGWGIFENGPDALEFAVNTLGEDYFTSKESYAFWAACPAVMRQNESVDFSYQEESALAFCNLLEAAKSKDIWLQEKHVDTDIEEHWRFYNDVKYCATGDLHLIIDALIAEQGEDPFGLGKNLSKQQKAWFVEVAEQVSEDCYLDPDTAYESDGYWVIDGGPYDVDRYYASVEEIEAYNEKLEKNITALKVFFGIDD